MEKTSQVIIQSWHLERRVNSLIRLQIRHIQIIPRSWDQ